jgi:predicted nucleic acid-binding protein
MSNGKTITKKLVFVDAGILIAAARGNDELAQRAMEILDDPEVGFASSVFVKLEVLPKPLYQNRKDEVLFYKTFFAAVSVWAEPISQVVQNACEEAVKSGLSAIDALHVSAAASVGADEFVTTEKPARPLHRSNLLPIRTIFPAERT